MSNPIYDLFIRYATDGPSSEMSLPEFSEAVAEARADQRRKDCAAVCQYCRWGDENWLPAKKYDAFIWLHQYRHRNDTSKICAAGPIHELHHQETQSKVG